MAYSFLEGNGGRKTEAEASYGVTGTVVSFPAQIECQALFAERALPVAQEERGLSSQPASEQLPYSALGQPQLRGGGLVNDCQRVVPWTLGSHKEKGLGLLAVCPSGPLPCIRVPLFSS